MLLTYTMFKNKNIKSYGIIDIEDDNFDTKLIELVRKFGVVVIKNVLASTICDSYMDTLLKELELVSSININDIESTWKSENLPQQVRPGMFHEIICNTPTINNIRFESNILKIFKAYYSKLHKKEYQNIDLVVSNDGVNIKPGFVPPFNNKIKKIGHILIKAVIFFIHINVFKDKWF